MSKLLKRALKYALVPAILMIAGKILGIFLVTVKYGYPIEIGNDINGFFSTQIYFNDAAITYFVNSVSDLTMLIVISVPLIYQIVKIAIFQSTMNNPKTIVKAAKFNILSWITKDDTTFLQTFVWCAFLWLTTGLIVKNGIEGDTYSWISYLAGALSLLSGLLTLKIFEIEIDRVYPDSKKYY